VAKTREELKEYMKVCKYCGETLLASPSKAISEFGAYNKTKHGWYYQSYCRDCQSEVTQLKSYNKHIANSQIKEYLREKRAIEKANRRWSIYKITIDLTSIEKRLETKFSRWHEKYYYVGVTKREPQQRWNEHLCNLKTGKHHNEIMQSIYNKLMRAYPELDDKEFQELFESDIIEFEVINKLDSKMEEYEAHKHEDFEIKALEHELFYCIKENYKRALINGYTEKDISYLKDDMIINLEHCKSSQKYLKEIDKKITPCVGSTRVIS